MEEKKFKIFKISKISKISIFFENSTFWHFEKFSNFEIFENFESFLDFWKFRKFLRFRKFRKFLKSCWSKKISTKQFSFFFWWPIPIPNFPKIPKITLRKSWVQRCENPTWPQGSDLSWPQGSDLSKIRLFDLCATLGNPVGSWKILSRVVEFART